MRTRQWKLTHQNGKFGQLIAAAMAGNPQCVGIDNDEAIIVMNARHYDLLREMTKIDAELLVTALLSAPRSTIELEPGEFGMRDQDIESVER